MSSFCFGVNYFARLSPIDPRKMDAKELVELERERERMRARESASEQGSCKGRRKARCPGQRLSSSEKDSAGPREASPVAGNPLFRLCFGCTGH